MRGGYGLSVGSINGRSRAGLQDGILSWDSMYMDTGRDILMFFHLRAKIGDSRICRGKT